MDIIDFSKPQTIFIATNEYKILLDELYIQLKSKNPYVYYVSNTELNYKNWGKICFLYQGIFDSNFYNTNSQYKYFNQLDNYVLENDCYMNNNYNMNKIYIFNNLIPNFINKNVSNIIIYNKLCIPNNILESVNYILYNVNVIEDDYDFRPNKKLKISHNIFQEKYSIYHYHINEETNTQINENTYYDNPYII